MKRLFHSFFGIVVSALLGACAVAPQEPVTASSRVQPYHNPAGQHAQTPQKVLKEGTVLYGDLQVLREQGMESRPEYRLRPGIRYTVDAVEPDQVWIIESPMPSSGPRRVVMRELARLGYPAQPGWQKPAGDIVLSYSEGDVDFRKTIDVVTVGPEGSHRVQINGSDRMVKAVPVVIQGKITMKPFSRTEPYPAFRYRQTLWYAPSIGIFVGWRYESATPQDTKVGSYGYVHRDFVVTKIDLPANANPAAASATTPPIAAMPTQQPKQ